MTEDSTTAEEMLSMVKVLGPFTCTRCLSGITPRVGAHIWETYRSASGTRLSIQGKAISWEPKHLASPWTCHVTLSTDGEEVHCFSGDLLLPLLQALYASESLNYRKNPLCVLD